MNFALLLFLVWPQIAAAFGPVRPAVRTTSYQDMVRTSPLYDVTSMDVFWSSHVDQENTDITKQTIRPLHQNWWPVITTEAIDPTRPNSIELLNQKLVLFFADGQWKCLRDRCSHRFAPLSEGRVVKSCLQCAYHGWEFDGTGSCQRAPQTSEATPRNVPAVEAFPVRIKAGMVFVWADPPSSKQLGESIPLPIFPLLEEWYKIRGDSSCFMRDLPYGYELLGENLLDLSHLPFSHHGVGGT